MTTIKTFCLGDLGVGTYLVYDEDLGSAALVDCGEDPSEILDFLHQKKITLASVCLTHAHADHIQGLGAVIAAFPQALVYVHSQEKAFLNAPELNLSAWMGQSIQFDLPVVEIGEGQKLFLAGLEFIVMHLPGHSPGSVGYYCEKESILFVGDTLFRGSVGRSDFPMSNPRQLTLSLKRLLTLPEETRVFPGHESPTSIGREKTSNPYLRDL